MGCLVGNSLNPIFYMFHFIFWPRKAGARLVKAPKTAFTLIELLVVIAIIGLLASMLMPALSRASGKARQVKCLSNLRQLGLGLVMYADDFDGRLPQTAHQTLNTNELWVRKLGPYVGGSEAIRLCPSDPQRMQRQQNGGSSYLLNDFLAVSVVDSFGRVLQRAPRMDQLREPSQTYFLFESSDTYGLSPFSDHTHSRTWLSSGWEGVIADIQPDRHLAGAPNEDHTQGSANYLYADGHVGALEAGQVYEWIEQGLNFAQPPEFRIANP